MKLCLVAWWPIWPDIRTCTFLSRFTTSLYLPPPPPPRAMDRKKISCIEIFQKGYHSLLAANYEDFVNVGS